MPARHFLVISFSNKCARLLSQIRAQARAHTHSIPGLPACTPIDLGSEKVCHNICSCVRSQLADLTLSVCMRTGVSATFTQCLHLIAFDARTSAIHAQYAEFLVIRTCKYICYMHFNTHVLYPPRSTFAICASCTFAIPISKYVCYMRFLYMRYAHFNIHFLNASPCTFSIRPPLYIGTFAACDFLYACPICTHVHLLCAFLLYALSMCTLKCIFYTHLYVYSIRTFVHIGSFALRFDSVQI